MSGYKVANDELKHSCLKESKAFYKSIKNVKEIQEIKLKSILERSTNTLIGKEYNFNKIRSINSFRNSVPLTTYEFYKKYIESIANGEMGILTTDPVLLFEPTSGSTSSTKLIPYTESLRNEFRKGISPWIYDLLHNRPKITNGSFYWSITPVSRQTTVTAGGIKIGFGDDSSYFHTEQQRLLYQLTAVPFNMARIRDIEEFRYATLLYLLRNKRLSFISIWNPTFLSLLMRPLKRLAEQLIKDIDDDEREIELKRIFNDYKNESALYERIWPDLSLISCWTDGNSSSYISEIRDLFPNVEIQGKGLIATEGFISFPLFGHEGSALSINSHFFEFLECCNNDNETKTKLAHELEYGENYKVIITTSGGLYRYNLGDIVQVVGFKEQCPLLRFIGRGSHFSDLFGEKLNEHHVQDVFRKAFQKYALAPSFFMLAPEKNDNGNYSYTIFIELAEPKFSVLDSLAKDLDTELKNNFHYSYCRHLGQLDPVRLYVIQSGHVEKKAVDIFFEEAHKQGKQIGTSKLSALSSSTGWSSIFKGRFIC